MYDKTPGHIPEDGEIAANDVAAIERSTGGSWNERQNGGAPARGPEPVKVERFMRLHAEEVIGRVKTPDAKTAARNAARFYEVPPPGPGASLKEMSAYRERAVKAGLPVTAQDIEDYQLELEDATRGETLMSCQETFVTSAADSFKPTPGKKLLAQAVLRHNPRLVEQMKMANMQLRDRRERVIPEFTEDLDPQQRLYENPERFRGHMNTLEKMGPLPKKPTADDIGLYCSQFRKVGVRLTLEDVERYQKALAEQGTRGLLRPGAMDAMPLSVAMLADLHRKPTARELVGADAERFAHILQKRPQMRPPLPKTSDREDAPAHVEQNVAQESPYAKWPPLGPGGLRGEAHEGASPAALDMTRGGKPVALHDGYQQTGRIVAFDSGRGEVIQRVGKDETVGYKLADFDRVMSREALENAVERGHDVRVNVRNGELAVTNLSLAHGTKFVAPAMPQGETKERPSSGLYGVPIPVASQADGPKMVRDGKEQPIPSGYRQTGRLFMVSNGEVFQRIDKDTSVRYPEADVRRALGGAEQLKAAVTYGHDVNICVARGELTATNLGLQHAQQRGGPPSHGRA